MLAQISKLEIFNHNSDVQSFYFINEYKIRQKVNINWFLKLEALQKSGVFSTRNEYLPN